MPTTPPPDAMFRVQFDPPYQFAVEPGYTRAVHCHDFRPEPDALQNCWRDPNTGLICLRPSWLSAEFGGLFKPLENWRYKAGYWETVKRTVDSNGAASMFTVVSPDTTTSIVDLEITIGINLIQLTSVIAADKLVWSLESAFTLVEDESFVVYYRTMSDELRRHRNWFAVQWDNIQIVFSMDGTVRVYRWADRADVTNASITPKLLEEFEIASPGDLLNKDGYFIFMPVPGFGLNVYHTHSAQRISASVSSAQAGITRGHLIALQSEDANTTVGGRPSLRLLRASKVRFAANPSPRAPHIFGFHPVIYGATATDATTATGSYIDGVFDPGYKPVDAPANIQASIVPHFATRTMLPGAVVAALRNAAGTAAWAAGTDRQGRVKVTLSTTNPQYTPFVLGSYVRWAPKYATRNTTMRLPDRLLGIEFSDNDLGRFEGTASVMEESAPGRALIERGDATFKLQKSLDGGDTWGDHAFGLARLAGDVETHITQSGMHYLAQWKLSDMWARFEEVNQQIDTAFDGQPVGAAINSVLTACGFSPISPLPTEFETTYLPSIPSGQSWRWGSRTGDNGAKIIGELLLLMRSQNIEWRLRFDSSYAPIAAPTGTIATPMGQWILEKKPRVELAYVLTPWTDEMGGVGGAPSARMVRIGDGSLVARFAVQPPEANIVQAIGMTDTNPNKAKMAPGTPLYNVPSLTDKTSVDYLGRAVIARVLFAPLTDVAEVNLMGRRLYDAIAHRRFLPVVPARRVTDALLPGTQCVVRGFDATGARVYLWYAWLKRRTVVLDYTGSGGDATPNVTYHLDSQWESEIG